MTGELRRYATFSLADDFDGVLAVSVFLAGLSDEPLLLLAEDSLDEDEESLDAFSLSLAAGALALEPFLLSVR
jgi:hypothetical protein